MIKKIIENIKKKSTTLAVKANVNTESLAETLADESGASALEIALAAVAAVVFICVIINAFTGIFSNTVIPGIQSHISKIFAIG